MTTIDLVPQAPGAATTPPSVVLVSTSMRAGSLSRRVLVDLEARLVARGSQTTFVDLVELPVSFAGAGDVPEELALLDAQLSAADGVVIGHPVHGYSMPGATKNLLDLVGSALTDKPFAVVTAAGTTRSHLAVRDLACSLVLENGSVWFPPTVQVTSDSIDLVETAERVDEIAASFLDFVARLAGKTVG